LTHCGSGQGDSFLPIVRLHKIMYRPHSQNNSWRCPDAREASGLGKRQRNCGPVQEISDRSSYDEIEHMRCMWTDKAWDLWEALKRAEQCGLSSHASELDSYTVRRTCTWNLTNSETASWKTRGKHSGMKPLIGRSLSKIMDRRCPVRLDPATHAIDAFDKVKLKAA
jgi:hypothetical protein